MTEQVHYRIDRGLVKKAKRLCGDMGITPTQAVSMFFAALVQEGGMPFRPAAKADGSGLVDIERRNRILRELDDYRGCQGRPETAPGDAGGARTPL
jgi:addiction module RelB/DinJ family antitoxin